jgi:hypothetical protein
MSGGKPEAPDDTEEAKALAEVAAKRWNRYQDTFVPLENAYMGDVMKVRDKGTYDDVGAMASAAYGNQFAHANDQLAHEMEQQGVDPSSGVFMGNSAALRKAQAVKQSGGVSAAKVANTNRFYDGLSSIVAMGQGQAGQAIGGLQSVANQAGEQAVRDAQSSFENASATRAGVGTMVGLGVSPYVDSQLHSEG